MFRKNGSFKQLIKDKGFYIALAVCVLAVGVLAVATLSALPPSANSGETENSTTTAFTTATTAQAAQNPVTNVADLRTTAPTTATATTTAAPTAAEPADLYVLPLSNEVCARFSAEQPVYSETMGDWRTHNGVDFVGTKGQTVRAAAAGQIRTVTKDTLWGDVIEIDHGFGLVTRYCGVSARNIKVGDTVSVGDAIGVLSDIPCEQAMEPHLHLELTASGKYLDAVEVIGVDVRYNDV